MCSRYVNRFNGGIQLTTPKGTPTIGESPMANRYLNAGHGALDWTLFFGCAKGVSDSCHSVKRSLRKNEVASALARYGEQG